MSKEHMDSADWRDIENLTSFSPCLTTYSFTRVCVHPQKHKFKTVLHSILWLEIEIISITKYLSVLSVMTKSRLLTHWGRVIVWKAMSFPQTTRQKAWRAQLGLLAKCAALFTGHAGLPYEWDFLVFTFIALTLLLPTNCPELREHLTGVP